MAEGKKRKITPANVGHDLLRCGIAGIAVSVVVAGIGALLGLWLYRDPALVPHPALQGATSGLLVVGSLAMLLSAFFFARRTWTEKAQAIGKAWRETFRCFNTQAVFLAVSVVILAAGCVMDLILRSV